MLVGFGARHPASRRRGGWAARWQTRGMRIRLRQVALVAGDLSAAERAIEEALGLSLCFRDPGVATFGLENALYPIGDKLLEVVSPTQPDTTAGRLLDKRGGDGGYMVLLQVDDLEATRRTLHSAEARIVFEAVTEGIVGLHIHPRDIGGAIVSIDQTDDWEAWPWAGPVWRDHVRTDRVSDIVAVEVDASDPAAMARRWGQVLGVEVEGTRVVFDEGEIRFVPAGDRGEGISAIELRAAADRDVELCGCRFSLRSH